VCGVCVGGVCGVCVWCVCVVCGVCVGGVCGVCVCVCLVSFLTMSAHNVPSHTITILHPVLHAVMLKCIFFL